MERTREDVKTLATTLRDYAGAATLKKALDRIQVSKLSEIEEIELGMAYEVLATEYDNAFLEKHPLKKYERLKYGRIWNPVMIEKKGKGGKVVKEPYRPLLDFEIEMAMYMMYVRKEKPSGGLGMYEHAKRGMEMIWHPKSRKPFTENPYSVRMLKAFCEHSFLALAGHASSGKTYNPAAWAIWNYLCDPWGTKVFVTSTSLKDSKGRIWGDVEELWDAAEDFFLASGIGNAPGKLVKSMGTIRCVLNGKETDKAGITMIAGDNSEAAKTEAKVKGFKRDRVILICDEMTDLSENLLNSAEGNLNSNHNFQMIGIGNPASYYDPLGKMCEPKEGWATVNETMFEWQGKRAYVIRFDAKTSPNVLARRNIYHGILPYEKYDEAKNTLGEHSPTFYQMYRGFWCPTGAIESIYTENEIILYGADKPCNNGWHWSGIPAWVWGLDPAFKNGGDDAVLTLGKVGNVAGKLHKVFERAETITIKTDVNLMEGGAIVPRDVQVMREVARILGQRKIPLENGAIDVSGAASFGSHFSSIVGAGWIPVEFGGSPSDLPTSNIDKRPAKEVYTRMVAELWHVGKELLRNGQIRGLDPDTINQMVARTYETKNGKIRVQPKEEMKKITGKSPDRADSLFICIFAARKRFDLVSKDAPKTTPEENGQSNWNAFVERMQIGTFAGQEFHYGV